MKIFESRKLTDGEFVGKVRKQLQRGKRWAWFVLFFSVAMIGLLIYFLVFAIDLVTSWNKDYGQNLQAFHAGLAVGLLIGCFAAILLGKAALYFYEFLLLLAGNRRDKLLVACYDQLHPLDAKAPAPSNVKIN